MAAHVKTGVAQILDMIIADQLNPDIIRSAVELSTFTEDNTLVWQALYEWVHSGHTANDTGNLWNKLTGLKPTIEKEWEDLGKPATREEWWAATLAQKQ